MKLEKIKIPELKERELHKKTVVIFYSSSQAPTSVKFQLLIVKVLRTTIRLIS